MHTVINIIVSNPHLTLTPLLEYIYQSCNAFSPFPVDFHLLKAKFCMFVVV